MFEGLQVPHLRVLLAAGLIFVTSLSVNQVATAQPNATNEWTWMGGSNTVGQSGVYGTLGVAAAGNVPGARDVAVSWTDLSGNLWLFGGNGLAASGSGYLNDLWKYTSSTGEWTWMSGSNTGSSVIQPGVYGTLGVPAAGNVPGKRYGAIGWTDSKGNLWLFGGVGYDANSNLGQLNDLWEYTLSTGDWTWMGGSNTYRQPGVYGTLGAPAASSVPGARQSGVGWTDLSGNLWLFGGIGYDSTGSAPIGLNDLWEYTPSTGNWTWMGGSNTGNQPGVYGTLGAPAASNVPGARYDPVSWTDLSGNLWLFGGVLSLTTSANGDVNDLWKYTPSSGNWTWMGGSNTEHQPGVYGTLGVPAAGNVPGARAYAVSWADSSGNLWVFGGYGYDATSNADIALNDLWEYTPSSGEWTWMSGSNTGNQPGVYGTLGVSAAGSVPGARYNPVSWTDLSGNLWLFGGDGQGIFNDLWEYTPPLTAATPTFSPAAGTYTSAQTVTISDTTPGAAIYYTTDGTTPTASSTLYSSPITVSSSETIKAIATATGYANSAIASATYTINIPTNPVPVINSFSPAFTDAGGAAFALMVNGSGFTASSTVYWGTSALTTTYGSANQLTAQVTAADIADSGTTTITVQTPAPGGGTSNLFQFEVDTAAGTTTGPIFTSTTATVTAGSAASYPVTFPSDVISASVTCLNLPTGATCSYSSTTNLLTIATSSTTPAGTYQITVVFIETVTGAAALILLPILLLPLVMMRRKLVPRGIWFAACLGLVLMIAAAFSIGCGGGGGGGGGSTPVTQTHQVTSSGVVSLTVR